MNTSVSLPNTIQIRPSRLTGLVVGVAILASVTTWSVSQVTRESHASSNPKSGVASSQDIVTKPYIDGVMALAPAQRAAVFGNVFPTPPAVQSVNAASPELQAVDVSRTPYVGSLNALRPEVRAELQRAANLAATADWARAEGLTGLSPASLKPSAAAYADAIVALPHDQLVAMFGNVG